MDSKIEALHTTGSTALGPALAISAGMIADSPMSEVILCTDGEPNVGIGSLSGSRRRGGADFYKRVNFDVVLCIFYTCMYSQLKIHLPLSYTQRQVFVIMSVFLSNNFQY